MSLSADIRAGGAYVELRLKDNQFVAGLRNAEKQLKAASKVMTGIGGTIAASAGVVTAGVGAMVARFVQVGSDIDDMSQRTGVAVEQLSSLEYAAKMSGSGAEDLEKALRKMQVNLTEVAGGSASAADKLSAIGVSYRDLKNSSPDEQFRMIAEGISKIEDPGKKAAAAMDIFGKSGANLVPLLSGGAAGIRALQHEARDLGLEMSQEEAEAAAKLGDAMDKLWAILGRVSDKIAFALTPVITDSIELISKFSGQILDFIDRNRETIAIVTGLVLAIGALGGSLVLAGMAASLIGTAFGAIAAIIAGIGTVIGIAGGAIATAIAFIMSPIGLVVAAITGFGAAALHYSGVAGSAWGWLSEKAGDLLGDVMEVFTAVKNAFMAGDLELATQLLWAGIELIWIRATGGVMTHLTTWWNGLRSFWSDSWYDLMHVLTEVGAGIQKIWMDITHGIYDRWNWTVGKVSEMMINSVAYVQGMTAEDTQAWLNESRAMTDQAAKASAKSYDAKLDSLGENLNKDLAQISVDKAASPGRIAAEQEQNISATQMRKQELEKQLSALINTPFTGPQLPKGQGGGLAAAMGGASAMMTASSAASTFRASEVSGLAAGSPVERLLNDSLTAQKEIANNTKNAGRIGR